VDILSTKYRIVYATVGLGSAWLKLHSLPKPEIAVIGDKSLLRGFALIDDNPMNLDGFVGERFLLSQPWNCERGLNDSTWSKITKYLMSL
jgi:5'(3')-deoxyribonucleotidase